MIDLRDLGISEGTFADAVTITDLGGSTRVTVEGFGTLLLRGVSGDGTDAISLTDFLLPGLTTRGARPLCRVATWSIG